MLSRDSIAARVMSFGAPWWHFIVRLMLSDIQALCRWTVVNAQVGEAITADDSLVIQWVHQSLLLLQQRKVTRYIGMLIAPVALRIGRTLATSYT